MAQNSNQWDIDLNKSSPPLCTIGVFSISMNEGFFARFHELHCEIQSLKEEQTSWSTIKNIKLKYNQ